MEKYCRLVICFIILFFSTIESRGQDPHECVDSFIKLFTNDKGKNLEVDVSMPLNAGALGSLKLKIFNHSDADEYLSEKLQIEVILASGSARVNTINFHSGIEGFNKPEALSGIIPQVTEGSRLVIDFKKGNICGSTIIIPLLPISKEFYKPIHLSEIIAEAVSAPSDSTLQYVGLNIYPDYISPEWMKNEYGVPLDSNGMIRIKGKISLMFCNFLFGQSTTFDSVSFSALRINYSEKTNLQFYNCVFEEAFELSNSNGDYVGLDNSRFKNHFSIDNSNLESVQLKNSSFSNSFSVPSDTMEPDYMVKISGKFKDIVLDSNKVNLGSEKLISIEGETNSLKMEGNTITSSLSLQNLTVQNNLAIFNNHLKGKIFLYGLRIPDRTSELYWSQLSGGKLGLINSIEIKRDGFSESVERFYAGIGEQDIKEEIQYKRLLKTYQQLSDIYKTNGDLESANGCYSEMKDVEGRRLAYLYKTQGGFQKYFRWKLNRLMKFYTDHGTDPARAIVISIWVVICFGIFYFFFPSDWDTTSKSKLIQNFKDFIQKNEKGYIIPFFVLLGGFSVSLLNAVTLSLNSFVTLGFGNIPTHGLARYVTILEGFIGWFLLSIFTVALINQVLG